MYSVFDEIDSRASIKDVYEVYTGNSLQKSGNDWSGICPFHDDKTIGSFKIRKGKYFKCYSCHEYGKVVDLVGKMFKIANKLDVIKKINNDFELGLNINIFNSNSRSKTDFLTRKKLYEKFCQWEKLAFYQMIEEYKKIHKSLKEELLDDDTFVEYVLRLGELDWWIDVFINSKGHSINSFKECGVYQLAVCLKKSQKFVLSL